MEREDRSNQTEVWTVTDILVARRWRISVGGPEFLCSDESLCVPPVGTAPCP